MPLEEWPEDGLLLSIAQENAVAETAYLVRQGAGQYHLRWSPRRGNGPVWARHAGRRTRGADGARTGLGRGAFRFRKWPLVVTRSSQGYEMTLPNRTPEPAILPAEIEESLSLPPTEVHKARDFLLVYKSQRDVEEFSVNRHLFDRVNLGTGGVIVTAPGDGVDFVSRFFTPQATILEDPVTGSAHCTLPPIGQKARKNSAPRPANLRPWGRIVVSSPAGTRAHLRPGCDLRQVPSVPALTPGLTLTFVPWTAQPNGSKPSASQASCSSC